MPKPQKVEAVDELKRRFQDSDGALLTAYRGLKVEEMKELRRALAPSGTVFKVVKNTLTRLAVKQSDLEELLPLLEGSTAIAFIKGDPVVAAKSLDEIAKKYPALEIKGGIIEGKILDAARAGALARVKPREVMLAQLAGMLQTPLQQLANLLNAPLRNVAHALGALKAKVEAEQPPQAIAEAPAAEAPAAEAPAAEAPAAEAPAAEAPAAEAPAAEAPEASSEPGSDPAIEAPAEVADEAAVPTPDETSTDETSTKPQQPETKEE